MASKVPLDTNLSPEMRRFLDDLARQGDDNAANVLTVATQAEAEAGTETTHYMTPERVSQAIAALTPPAPAQYFTLVDSQDASGSADIRFALDSTYRNYKIVVANAIPGTATVQFHFEVSTDAGLTWKTSGYLSSIFSHATDASTANTATTASVRLSNYQLSGSGGWSGELLIPNPSGSSNHKQITFTGSYLVTGSTVQDFVFGGGLWVGTTAIDKVRFIMGAGNIASGSFNLYGLKDS